MWSVRWQRTIEKTPMLDDSMTGRLARDNEDVTEAVFQSMGLTTVRLDSKRARRMPEFLVSDAIGPLIVCEVKTIFSAQFDRARNVQISNDDSGFTTGRVSERPVDFGKLETDLFDAVGKYRRLLSERPELSKVPLVAALFFDPLADFFSLVPSSFASFPELSALLRLPSKRFAYARIDQVLLLQNKAATFPLPERFIRACKRERT